MLAVSQIHLKPSQSSGFFRVKKGDTEQEVVDDHRHLGLAVSRKPERSLNRFVPSPAG